MLSYCVSLLSIGAYEAMYFIRNNSQNSILISVGSLLFVLGTVLRRHMRVPNEIVTSQAPILWEVAMPATSHRKAAEELAIT